MGCAAVKKNRLGWKGLLVAGLMVGAAGSWVSPAQAADDSAATPAPAAPAATPATPATPPQAAQPARRVVKRSTRHTAHAKAKHRASPSKKTAAHGVKRLKTIAAAEPASSSMGHLYGLQKTSDALDLKSSVALVVDQDTNEVLLSKNPQAVLPIASITKLMTALVVTEAHLPMDEMLSVTEDDVRATAGNRSRLRLGTKLTRGEMLHLALMSSENRAAHVLGRTYPGGMDVFVEKMNAKAHELGMEDTHYVEPTGLSSSNQSSAEDLTRLVRAAYQHPIIRELSTSTEAVVPLGRRQVEFHSTNGLLRDPQWDIGLQKTGYISAAGHCLIMQAKLAGRHLIMVLLDSAGRYSRIGDAERIRKWLDASSALLPTVGAHPAQ